MKSKKYIIALAILLLFLILNGCASSNSYGGVYSQGYAEPYMDYSAEMDDASYGAVSNAGYNRIDGLLNSKSASNYDYNYEESKIDSSSNFESSANFEYEEKDINENRDSSLIEDINYEKLVYKANIDIEAKEFEEATNKLNSWIEDNNGIVQSQRYGDNSDWYWYSNYGHGRYRSLSMTVRVPTKQYNEIMNGFGDIGHIKNQNSTVENISQQYYNTKAYLESYQNQLSNLQLMYDKATTIEEMMQIEARIADVNAEILSLTTEIQSMDMDVAYSTINITLTEVVDYSSEPTPIEKRTFLDRLKLTAIDSWENFLDNAEDFLFWVIMNIWGIIIFIAIVLIIKSIIKKKRKNKSVDTKTKRFRFGKKDKHNKKEDDNNEEIKLTVSNNHMSNMFDSIEALGSNTDKLESDTNEK